MSSIAVFLRGMNLGNRRITNDDLKDAFRAIGFDRVDTFRASGNVVLHDVDPGLSAARIEAGLHQQLGYAVPTALRTSDELAAILAFSGLAPKAAGGGKLQVMLLKTAPDAGSRDAVLALANGLDDRLVFRERELFWLPAKGLSTSELSLAAIDKLLGFTTTRTLGTIQGVARKAGL